VQDLQKWGPVGYKRGARPDPYFSDVAMPYRHWGIMQNTAV